ERLGFFFLPSLRVSVGQQCSGALEIVVWLFRDHPLQVGQRGRGITQVNGANTTPVKGVGGIGASGNGFVKRGSRQLELAVVHIKVAEFFIVPSRRIIVNSSFQLCDALAPRKHFEGLAHQSDVGQRLDEKIDNRPERTEKQDDKN